MKGALRTKGEFTEDYKNWLLHGNHYDTHCHGCHCLLEDERGTLVDGIGYFCAKCYSILKKTSF